jgi:hypothetical protein
MSENVADRPSGAGGRKPEGFLGRLPQDRQQRVMLGAQQPSRALRITGRRGVIWSRLGHAAIFSARAPRLHPRHQAIDGGRSGR